MKIEETKITCSFTMEELAALRKLLGGSTTRYEKSVGMDKDERLLTYHIFDKISDLLDGERYED